MKATTARTVEAGGIRFECREAGAGPLVLCLHGFPDTPETWSELMPALAGAGFRVVAPSMRGYFPTSAPADGDYSSLALGRDVLALIDALGEERAHVVGHDWGALAAYAAAGLAPAKITRLVTIAIPHPASIDGASLAFWKKSWHFAYFGLAAPLARARLARRAGFGSASWIQERWSPGWRPTDEERAALERCFDGARGRGSGVRGPVGYYTSFVREQVWQALGRDRLGKATRLGQTSVPTLTLLGSRDGALGLDDLERTRRCFSGEYRLRVLEAGHFLHRERPDEVARAVLDFLGPSPGVADAPGAAATIDRPRTL